MDTAELSSRFADVFLLIFGTWSGCTLLSYILPSIPLVEGDADHKTASFILALMHYAIFSEIFRKSNHVLRFVTIFAFGLIFSTVVVLIKVLIF